MIRDDASFSQILKKVEDGTLRHGISSVLILGTPLGLSYSKSITHPE
jgi:hypothetical protein